MKMVTKTFTSASELSNLKRDLTIFLNTYCKNPFSLYPFIENYMENYCPDSIPLILVSIVNEKIVGVAPLKLKKSVLFQITNFLLPYSFSPDFVVADEYREDVLNNFLHVIVNKIKCRLIELDLSAGSQNLPILEKLSTNYQLSFKKQSEDNMSHCLISVQGSLDEFENSQGSKKKFKRISRNLDKMGDWKIVLFENWQDDKSVQDAFDKLMSIEKMSWKENWRLQTGAGIDKELLWVWNSAQSAAKSNPDFKCKIWFLELNGQAIEYHLVIEYVGTAYFTKTSYVEEYKQLSPGIFVRNEIIGNQFKRQEMKAIDFLTDLPYMKNWDVICLSRFRFTLTENSLSNLFSLKMKGAITRFLQVVKY